jgi:hypothetical protein
MCSNCFTFLWSLFTPWLVDQSPAPGSQIQPQITCSTSFNGILTLLSAFQHLGLFPSLSWKTEPNPSLWRTSATGSRHPPTHQNLFTDTSARLADISATTQNSKEGKHPIHFMKGILVPAQSLRLANLPMFESRLKWRKLKWLKMSMCIQSRERRPNHILCTILKYKDQSKPHSGTAAFCCVHKLKTMP